MGGHTHSFWQKSSSWAHWRPCLHVLQFNEATWRKDTCVPAVLTVQGLGWATNRDFQPLHSHSGQWGNGLTHSFPHCYRLSLLARKTVLSLLYRQEVKYKRGLSLPSHSHSSLDSRTGDPGKGLDAPVLGLNALFFKATFAYQSLSKFQVTELN